MDGFADIKKQAMKNECVLDEFSGDVQKISSNLGKIIDEIKGSDGSKVSSEASEETLLDKEASRRLSINLGDGMYEAFDELDKILVEECETQKSDVLPFSGKSFDSCLEFDGDDELHSVRVNLEGLLYLKIAVQKQRVSRIGEIAGKISKCIDEINLKKQKFKDFEEENWNIFSIFATLTYNYFYVKVLTDKYKFEISQKETELVSNSKQLEVDLKGCAKFDKELADEMQICIDKLRKVCSELKKYYSMSTVSKTPVSSERAISSVKTNITSSKIQFESKLHLNQEFACELRQMKPVKIASCESKFEDYSLPTQLGRHESNVLKKRDMFFL